MATATALTADATNAALALKADTATVTSELAMKADISAAVMRANNLGDLTDKAASRTNLGVSQGAYFDVRDYNAKGDGTTDDFTAIQAAISAAGDAGGGTVFIPHGTYKLSAGLTIWVDNVSILGESKGASILKPATGYSYDVISTQIPGTSGTAGFTALEIGIENLTIDCSDMAGTDNGRGNAIHLYGARNCYIRDLNIVNAPNWAIVLDGDATNTSYNVDVRNNTIDGGAAGILLIFSDQAHIVNNFLLHANANTAAAEPVFGTTSNVGYLLHAVAVNCLIQGNVFGSGGTYTTPAIFLETSGVSRIIGNRFDRCRYEAIKTSASNTIIQGNNIGNPSSVGSTSGIVLSSGSNIISGNSFDTINGAAHYTYCVSETATFSNQVIQGNRFVGGTSGSVNLNSSSTGNRVSGNPGYNPVGHIVSPALPGTGVTYTNKFGVDATVHISGGTVTAVAINGTTTGNTSGTFRVPSAQTIVMTYSVNPTWNWFLD